MPIESKGMNKQSTANELIFALMRKIMNRFDGPIQNIMGVPLMVFDEEHLQPLISGEYTGTREDYYKAVQDFMTHMSQNLNNLYDDHMDLAGLMDEKGIKHNIEPNNLLAQHVTIFLEVYDGE